MPPKKTPVKTSLKKETPEFDTGPLNNFLAGFNDLMLKWFEYRGIYQELKVHVLKDGKYTEEVPEEVFVEPETEEITMSVKRDLPPPPEEKEFTKTFTEEELQNLRLEDCEGVPRQPPLTIAIGLGFDKDGIFSKIKIEDTILPTRFMEIFRVIKSRFINITKLHLRDCKLKSGNLVELGGFLRDYHSVVDINLDFNPVHEQNFHLLIRQTGVEHLSLRNCKIDCFGAKMISRAILFEPGIVQKLLSLNLNGNLIHDEGLAVLTQSLRTNFTLQCLSVSKNLISTYGIFELSKILQKFPLDNHEDLERRFSYFKYLENLTLQRSAPEITIPETSNSSLAESRKSTGSSRQKRKSSRSSKTEKKEKVSISPASDMTMSDILNYNLHPLLVGTCEENGIKYCVGNFSLRYINLSYNWFGKVALEALLKAVEYQVEAGPQKIGPGLFQIDVEGLYLFEGLSEIEKLKSLLANRYVPPTLDKRSLFH